MTLSKCLRTILAGIILTVTHKSFACATGEHEKVDSKAAEEAWKKYQEQAKATDAPSQGLGLTSQSPQSNSLSQTGLVYDQHGSVFE